MIKSQQAEQRVPLFQPMRPAFCDPAFQQDCIITGDGYRLPLRSWTCGLEIEDVRAVVIALHGFCDHSGSFSGLGEYLSAHDIDTYAYDQRGFGRTENRGIWSSTHTLVSDALTVVTLIGSRYPGRPVVLLGESMGGAVVMSALAGLSGESAPVERAVLLAPAIWSRSTMPTYQRAALALIYRFFPWLGIAREVPGLDLSDDPTCQIEKDNDPLCLHITRIDMIEGLVSLMDSAVASAPALAVPSLIMFGDKDQLYPEKAVRQLLHKLPIGCHKIMIHDDGHHLLLRGSVSPTTKRSILSWISGKDDLAAPLPG